MYIPQTPTNRNNAGFTDNSVVVNISGSNENLVFTEKVNNLPSDDARVSGSSSINAEKNTMIHRSP